MPTAQGTFGSTASGAAAGTAIAPGWGTAIGAGLGLISSLFDSNQSNQDRGAIAASSLQQADNERRYNAALTAEAMRRASAGTQDSFGSSTEYDPYTNTWKAMLGQLPEAAQRSSYDANVQRGSVDIPRASYGNDVAAQRESEVARHVSGAGNTLANYTPVTDSAERGALQDATSRANNETFNPLIAAASRQAMRTGTAAGPVMADLGRASADSLAKQMSDNVVKAQGAASDINTRGRASLADSYKALAGGTQGARSSPSLPGADPITSMTSGLGARASAAAQPASLAGYGSPARSNAYTAAAFGAADRVPSSQYTASLINNYGQAGGQLYDALFKKGNDGSSVWGDIKGWFGSSPSAAPGGYPADQSYNWNGPM